MGEALIKGVLSANLYDRDKIVATDISSGRLSYIRSTYGIKTCETNIEAVQSSAVIIIAVKPKSVKGLMEEISPAIDENQLIISIAAGVSTGKIMEWLKKEVPVIRVMPNTPVIVLEGAIAISPGPGVDNKTLDVAQNIFDSVGKTIIVPEKHMNAVTGLSGSGPAYIFTIIEALADGGVRVGLPRRESTLLAVQTVLGSAKMVLETGEHTGILKERVTSPGGTTIEGLFRLEMAGIRAALMAAVENATKKADEIEKGV